jgi:anti-anti-sigma factor
MNPEPPPEKNVLVVSLEEPLDPDHLGVRRQEIEAWVAEGGTRVVVSLEALEFINSSGLGFLIKLRKRLKERGGHLVLCAPREFVAKALRVLDLDELFHTFATEEEAVRALRQ